jgi:hypothetical protein
MMSSLWSCHARCSDSPRSSSAGYRRMPLRYRCARDRAGVALINMFLFPVEVGRVLAEDGVLLWVSTNGDQTPIYLSPTEVLNALPGTWDGTTSQAGWGTWLTARRTRARTDEPSSVPADSRARPE